MPARKTCPVCHRKWPEGKDPAEGVPMMELRLADFAKGLKPDSDSLEADVFQSPADGQLTARAAQRLMEIEEAEFILLSALRKVEEFKARFRATPLVMSIPAYVKRHGQPAAMSDSLETTYQLDVGEYVVSVAGQSLRFAEKGEDDGV
jgi:hypothetical protein